MCSTFRDASDSIVASAPSRLVLESLNTSTEFDLHRNGNFISLGLFYCLRSTMLGHCDSGLPWKPLHDIPKPSIVPHCGKLVVLSPYKERR